MKQPVEKKIKLLFIGHDASLTGAPLVLYYLIEQLLSSKKYDCALLLLKGGAILSKYRTLGMPVFVNDTLPVSTLEFIHLLKPDVVYGNTILTAELLSKVGESKSIPVILHVHELSHSIRILLGWDDLKKYSFNINTIIATGSMVASCLKNEVKIKVPKILGIEEFMPFDKMVERFKKERRKYSLFPSYTNKHKIVLGCGTGYWRKGVDIFLQVAKQVTDRIENVTFVWIGGFSPVEMAQIEYDKKNMGLRNEIIFTGPVDDTFPFFKTSTVFLLTSREDPFPLVCLEAACMKVPIVCFDKGTGIVEFVKERAALSSKYLDVEDTTEKVIKLLNNDNLAVSITKRAYKKVISNNNVKTVVPKIIKTIRELAPSGNIHVPVTYKNIFSNVNKNGILISKLYFDKEMSFSEEKVLKSFISFTSKTKFEICFYIDKSLDSINLRWDPTDFGTCHLKISEISSTKKSGEKTNYDVKKIPHNGNISTLKKGFIYFNHDDPYFLLLNYQSPVELRIKGEMIIIT